jgi:hypothetical protein
MSVATLAAIDNHTNGQVSPSLYDDAGDGPGIGGMRFRLQARHGHAPDTSRTDSLDGATGVAYPGLPWEPKHSFYALADYYARLS